MHPQGRVSVGGGTDWLACARVENEQVVRHDLMEIEQRADGICDAIKRSLADALAAEPIIFDEANH